MSDVIRPPANIAPYIDVLGVDGTIDFLLEFGGAELYLAANPKGRSRLAKKIGVEKAAQLAAAAEYFPRRVPTAKPFIAAVWRSRGLPVAEIARRLHSSDVAVRGWLKKAAASPKTDPRQLPLL